MGVARSSPLFFEVALPSADPRAALAQGVRADALGFDGISLPDHFFQPKRFEEGREGRCDLFTTLGALAQATSRVRLGQAVVCAAFRHPVQVARAVASLDQLSDGRAELGIGAGWYRDEFEALGLAFPAARERRAILDESLAIIRRYWTEERLNFQGKHFEIVDLPTDPPPHQRPHPPIGVGGSAPALLEISARHANWVNLIPPWLGPRKMDLRRGLEQPAVELARKVEVLREVADKLGRDASEIGVAVNLQVFIDPDAARVEAVLPGVASLAGVSVAVLRASPMTLVGTPEDCRAKLSELQAVIGFQRAVLGFFVSDQIELFADAVMKPLRSAQ